MLSDQLRVKQGPLARVWLASHWERKISKSQFLQTNLEKTIDVINQEEEPITLRVSGQLLLGVVRIYSRKTKYLLEDCNEALVKIKLAFKKGDVNMPDIHQTVANVNTITLQDKLTEFDILLPDLPFNSNINAGERDPILDSLNDISMSQDITLSDMQNSFSFGNFEIGRGVDGVEVGRRDNEAALADATLNLDDIADPLKDMNLNDNQQNGLFNDGVDFDFDMNDNVDYGVDYADETNFPADFNMQFDESTNASLLDVGIVEDSQLAFDISPEPTVRRRKRLVVDKITEIPTDDLRRYTNDASAIVSKETQLTTAKKATTAVNLTRPFGDSIGSELESMFSGLGRKRRASTTMADAQKEARLDPNTPGGPTPGGPGLTSDFHFDDDGYGGGDDYGYEADYNNDINIDAFNNDSLLTQSTQSFNTTTRETLEKLEGHLATQEVVNFGELAGGTCRKSEAARLFYDILLLTTKDKIKVKQERPFGEIQISAATTLVQ